MLQYAQQKAERIEHSRAQVMAMGASFQGGGPMVMNDHKLGCEPMESAGTAPG